jgi:hypothetical protein
MFRGYGLFFNRGNSGKRGFRFYGIPQGLVNDLPPGMSVTLRKNVAFYRPIIAAFETGVKVQNQGIEELF